MYGIVSRKIRLILAKISYKILSPFFRNMPKTKQSEKIERVTIKIPASLAEYFRKAFPHGKRSDFVASCIRRYRREQTTREIEDEFRDIVKKHIKQ
ncbi:MAG: hypothetical protein A2261_02115 [Candidatus Magasanikbacteria bacterium RIFOXYA2_FULL_44_8]|uniref:Uncharacterized protein n=1 Tax=Candidatus Magasanikbacteria bacterium RIFOXYA2_FULL_44_8 TaxID=1798696 RepID=A0A1F6NKF1_9BACT|nr:MAG: hypothetical protein A2261_02115 [Candidatus Magasanikbacteria bacterium RIFOXYA2_FULL_44_8]